MAVFSWAAGLLLAAAAVVLLRALLHRLPSNRPPIFEEIPFIGGILGFIDSPIKLARRGYDALGEVRCGQSLALARVCLSTPTFSAADELST